MTLTDTQLGAWTAFLTAHSTVTRGLERTLKSEHDLTLSEYDVLVQLGHHRRLRPVELARAVLLTRSGITRVTQGLERAGLVERIACPDDQRGHLFRLSQRGRAALRRASATHRDDIRDRFAGRYDDAELDQLAELLERLRS